MGVDVAGDRGCAPRIIDIDKIKKSSPTGNCFQLSIPMAIHRKDDSTKEEGDLIISLYLIEEKFIGPKEVVDFIENFYSVHRNKVEVGLDAMDSRVSENNLFKFYDGANKEPKFAITNKLSTI